MAEMKLDEEYYKLLTSTLEDIDSAIQEMSAAIEDTRLRLAKMMLAEKELNSARALGQATLQRTIIPASAAERTPVGERAGTHINAREALRILVGKNLHGLLDTDKHVYQGGGEANKFIYQKKGWITLDKQVWLQIRDEAGLVIEMVDHPTNTVYRISKATFTNNLREYNAGGNDRVGVALSFWQHLDKDGVLLSPEGS